MTISQYVPSYTQVSSYIKSFWLTYEPASLPDNVHPFKEDYEEASPPILKSSFRERLRFNIFGKRKLSDNAKELHRLLNEATGIPDREETWFESAKDFVDDLRHTNPIYLALWPVAMVAAFWDAAISPWQSKWEDTKFDHAELLVDPTNLIVSSSQPKGCRIYADAELEIFARRTYKRVLFLIRADEDEFLPKNIEVNIVASWGEVIPVSIYSKNLTRLRETNTLEFSVSHHDFNQGTEYLVDFLNSERPDKRPHRLTIHKPADNVIVLKDYRQKNLR